MLLFQSDDWAERCERLVLAFNLEAQGLYDDPARSAGGIHAEDRHGVPRFFPLISLSIGAIRAHRGRYRSAEAVASAAAAAKHAAKMANAGLLVSD